DRDDPIELDRHGDDRPVRAHHLKHDVRLGRLAPRAHTAGPPDENPRRPHPAPPVVQPEAHAAAGPHCRVEAVELNRRDRHAKSLATRPRDSNRAGERRQRRAVRTRAPQSLTSAPRSTGDTPRLGNYTRSAMPCAESTSRSGSPWPRRNAIVLSYPY